MEQIPSMIDEADSGPSDVSLRGVPAGLPSPAQLAKQQPDTPQLLAYSRISLDWRARSKKASPSAWGAKKGVANQHRRNDFFAARFGAVVVYRYTDNDLSAFKRNVVRDDFQAMLKALRNGVTPEGHRIDGVICVDQDRLQRTDSDWEDFVDALTSAPGRLLWTPSGPSDLTEEAEIIKTGVMALVNKIESLKKRRRFRDWHQDRILDGLPHSGARPFGWEEDREKLRPSEAAYLSWCIDERIAGKGMATLCTEAKDRNLRGSRGADIKPASLQQMITAPRVCGYRAHRGELVLDEYGEPVVGNWETVTTPEKWRAVCATFKNNGGWSNHGKPSSNVPKTAKYLGTTLLRCVNVVEHSDENGKERTRICNHTLSGGPNKSKRSPYIYQCNGCYKNAISGPFVDKQLEMLLFAKLAQAQATWTPRKSAWPKEAELQAKLVKLQELEEQWQADKISDAMFYRNAPRIETAISELRSDRTSWEKDVARSNEAPGDILAKWRNGDYDLAQKRAILFKMFVAVQVARGVKGTNVPDPKRLTPIWNV